MLRRPLLLGLIALSLGSLSLLWLALSREDEPNRAQDGPPVSRTSTPSESSPTASLGTTPERPAREAIGETAEAPGEARCPVTTADLLVTLTDGRRAVGPALLTLDEPGGPRARVDADTGQAIFEGLRPGVRWIQVSDLPRGWRLARSSSRRVLGNPEVRVELVPGDNECEILLEPAANVFGVVLGPAGEPLEGVTVLFSGFDETGYRNGQLPTRFAPEAGRYEGALQEGIWTAQVIGTGREYSLPSPQVVRLRPGATAEVNFICERAACAIRGRILDEAGRPFGALRLTATRIDALTETVSGKTVTVAQEAGSELSSADGSFRFEGLARGHYRIRVDPNHFRAVASPGVNGVGAPVEPVDVEFGSEPVLVVEITARRSRPIHVRGTIEVLREDLAAHETPSLFLRTRVGGGSLDTVRSWI